MIVTVVFGEEYDEDTTIPHLTTEDSVHLITRPRANVDVWSPVTVNVVSEVRVPVTEVQSDEPPPEPLEAAVILPFASTVTFALVYEPAVTPEFARVVAKLPVPLPVTSPVSVMFWSQVFVPERFVAVTLPVNVAPLRFAFASKDDCRFVIAEIGCESAASRARSWLCRIANGVLKYEALPSPTVTLTVIAELFVVFA